MTLLRYQCAVGVMGLPVRFGPVFDNQMAGFDHYQEARVCSL